MTFIRKWPLYLLVLCTGMLISLGLYAGLSHSIHADAAPVPRLTDLRPDHFADPRLQIAALAKRPAAAPVRQAAVTDAPATPAKLIARYVTTAYYLNVREAPSNKSTILRTVEQGTKLDVLRMTDNGWLALEDGGFVHGDYAKPLPVKAVASPEPVDPVFETSTAPLPETDEKPAKPTSTVISDSGLTEEGIAEILKGTALEGHGLETAVLEIEDEYGVNAYFTIAVMKLESGNGESRLAKSKNNLFGLNATGGSNKQAFAFSSKADCVRKFGELISKNYAGKGYTTVDKVARKYCPANSKWSSMVKSIMKSDHKKVYA